MEVLSSIKTWLLAACGLALSAAAESLGGYDHFLHALIIFMAVDFLTGCIHAITTGRLSSSASFKGLAKKVCMLFMIVVAVILDGLLSAKDLTRNAVIIALGINELISIMENMGQMGITMPAALTNALEMLSAANKGQVK